MVCAFQESACKMNSQLRAERLQVRLNLVSKTNDNHDQVAILFNLAPSPIVIASFFLTVGDSSSQGKRKWHQRGERRHNLLSFYAQTNHESLECSDVWQLKAHLLCMKQCAKVWSWVCLVCTLQMERDGHYLHCHMFLQSQSVCPLTVHVCPCTWSIDLSAHPEHCRSGKLEEVSKCKNSGLTKRACIMNLSCFSCKPCHTIVLPLKVEGILNTTKRNGIKLKIHSALRFVALRWHPILFGSKKKQVDLRETRQRIFFLDLSLQQNSWILT